MRYEIWADDMLRGYPECSEMYCWPTIYTETGELDWDAMMQAERAEAVLL